MPRNRAAETHTGDMGTPKANPYADEYQGTLRFKGASVKYLKYDTDKYNRPGYWPNCHQRSERWDNYRTHQWEDNRFESCSATRRYKAQEKMNKSNRSPFQNTPYSEQSPTMLFYQQKLSMSRSMPTLSTRGKSQQQDRIFNFAQTQEQLVSRAAPMAKTIKRQERETQEMDDEMTENAEEYVNEEEAQPEMVAVN